MIKDEMRSYHIPDLQKKIDEMSPENDLLIFNGGDEDSVGFLIISKKCGEIFRTDFCDVAINQKRVPDCPNLIPYHTVVSKRDDGEDGYVLSVNGYRYIDGEWKFKLRDYVNYILSVIKKGIDW